jgi:CRISPR-associated protein Csd1
MTWIQALCETYEKCTDIGPLYHKTHQDTNVVKITLNEESELLDLTLYNDKFFYPVTNKSKTGRTSGSAPYPLCENLKYLAGDYCNFVESKCNKRYFEDYLNLLNEWIYFDNNRNTKLKVIHKYVSKSTLFKDLLNKFPTNNKDSLLEENFESYKKKKIIREKDGLYKISDKLSHIFIFWEIEIDDDKNPDISYDKNLQDSWSEFEIINCSKEDNGTAENGICCITGEEDTLITKKHPTILGGLKLISSNDKDGFTYRGRFTNPDQLISIGYLASIKVHSVIDYLISNDYSTKISDRTIISWSSNLNKVPTIESICDEIFNIQTTNNSDDLRQGYAKRLNSCLKGYKKDLGSSSNINILVLNKMSKGRASLLLFRNFEIDDYLSRLNNWYTKYSWCIEKDKRKFIRSPTFKEIADQLFDRNDKSSSKLKANLEYNIFCLMIDNQPLPKNILYNLYNRILCYESFKSDKKVKNRINSEKERWLHSLSIVCSLVKGIFYERNYQMALEEDRKDRSYLFGRLLAVADNIESFATEDKKITHAMRLLQRFSNYPQSTWKDIYIAIQPYINDIKKTIVTKEGISINGIVFIKSRLKILDQIYSTFDSEDFRKNEKLSPDFLLGFHCQRSKLFEKNDKSNKSSQTIE